jgi:phosphoglycerate-specific signal transduction histidine kinase
MSIEDAVIELNKTMKQIEMELSEMRSLLESINDNTSNLPKSLDIGSMLDEISAKLDNLT